MREGGERERGRGRRKEGEREREREKGRRERGEGRRKREKEGGKERGERRERIRPSILIQHLLLLFFRTRSEHQAELQSVLTKCSELEAKIGIMFTNIYIVHCYSTAGYLQHVHVCTCTIGHMLFKFLTMEICKKKFLFISLGFIVFFPLREREV